MKKFSIIFFLALFTSSCQSFDFIKKSKVIIEKFDIEGLTLHNITFLPDYVIKNSVKLTFDEKGLVQL